MKLNKNLIYFPAVLACVVTLLLSGCSSTRPEGKTDAEVLYKEAQELVKDKRYLLATEKLNQIKSKYPYSFYAKHAELLQANILFDQENYVEAAAAYVLFRDFHPKHEQLDFVTWRIAESYFNQLPSTFDRDLGPANEAIKYYQELTQKYPKYEKVAEAQGKIKKCQDMLKAKDKYIADFYFKTSVYDAAKYRYRDILSLYPDDQELKDHSMLRIVLSSFESNEFDECLKAAKDYEPQVGDVTRKEIAKVAAKCEKKASK